VSSKHNTTYSVAFGKRNIIMGGRYENATGLNQLIKPGEIFRLVKSGALKLYKNLLLV
jgi:hypothetical protein